MDEIEQFFSEDDELNPLQHFHPNPPWRLPSLSRRPSSSLLSIQPNNSEPDSDQRSVMSTRSTQSTNTFSSIKTFFQKDTMRKMSLIDACNFIDLVDPLEDARIVSVDGCVVTVGLVAHSFLVLRLQRPKKKDIWMRVDRWFDHRVSAFRLALAGGITEANDQVVFSANKAMLIGNALYETSQDLVNQPTLHNLSSLFRIISAELVQYQIWPHNEWFFCSLIQQYLVGLSVEGQMNSDEWFRESGKAVQHANIDKPTRKRVFQLCWMDSFFPALLRTLSQCMNISGLATSSYCMMNATWSVATSAGQIQDIMFNTANHALEKDFQKLVSALKDLCWDLVNYSGSGNKVYSINFWVPIVMSEMLQSAKLIIAYAEAYGKSKDHPSLATLEEYFHVLPNHLKAVRSQLSNRVISHNSDIWFNGIEQLKLTVGFQDLQTDTATTAHTALHKRLFDTGCSPGVCTCVAVASATASWAAGGTQHPECPSYLGQLDPRKHLLWLCGPVGSGKSRITMSVAHSLLALGILGAFFELSSKDDSETCKEKLFSTLVLQLAAYKPTLQETLLRIMQGVSPVRYRSLSLIQQRDTYLLPMLHHLAISTPPHHTTIIIDGLDQLQDSNLRGEITHLLVELGAKLPDNVYVLINSCIEDGVYDALDLNSAHTILLKMEQIPHPTKQHCVHILVHQELYNLLGPMRCKALTEHSLKLEDPIEWATLNWGKIFPNACGEAPNVTSSSWTPTNEQQTLHSLMLKPVERSPIFDCQTLALPPGRFHPTIPPSLLLSKLFLAKNCLNPNQ
ncbi:hypothetical protein DL93DRAFT_2174112 [Clavulina sp. PMI_390]|nr:hypothetical protein DL93DRAFT_2174112 [Clavulina sp. PMI_390]